ncbi:MAG: hypothetical protein HYY17_10720 [Planctomycetes bacterium]|nr:hypothetical protein [Planctomycetota bacterium]
MHHASFVQRVAPACPVCRASDFLTHRRTPGSSRGCVVSHCLCRRCGLAFTYEEDRRGRPVRK